MNNITRSRCQSLYFFFCSSPQLFSSLRLYLTLQLKFFDGIMLIFITATTITILLFLIFLDLLSLKKITNKIKKNHFGKKKKQLFEFFVFISIKAFNYLFPIFYSFSVWAFFLPSLFFFNKLMAELIFPQKKKKKKP